MLTTHNPTKIAALNDAARKSFSGCRVYMTPGVQALYQTQAIAARVQAYDDFTERNDPYGERDFGSFEFCGETIFWKIEYETHQNNTELDAIKKQMEKPTDLLSRLVLKIPIIGSILRFLAK